MKIKKSQVTDMLTAIETAKNQPSVNEKMQAGKQLFGKITDFITAIRDNPESVYLPSYLESHEELLAQLVQAMQENLKLESQVSKTINSNLDKTTQSVKGITAKHVLSSGKVNGYDASTGNPILSTEFTSEFDNYLINHMYVEPLGKVKTSIKDRRFETHCKFDKASYVEAIKALRKDQEDGINKAMLKVFPVVKPGKVRKAA